jgi:DNA sulfur modification protein DndD
MTGLEAELHSRMAARTDQLTECMRAFKSAVLSKHIARLEDAIFDSYRKLLRKEGLVSKVAIDPIKMELALFDVHNHPIPLERLSAGERQLLATSILWGLAKSSGRALPVVIDTPLGRLDATHREKLINHYFPDASHQVILLSTDEEINEKYYSQIKRHVGLEYQLAYDESTGGTSVKTGYLFAEVA